MTTLIVSRDGVDKTATVLTRNADATSMIFKDEHSDSNPSTLELRRKLPSGSEGVRRVYVNRKLGVTLYPGTDQEKRGLITAKFELSIPIGAEDADVNICVDDLVGTSATATFDDLRQYGIVSIS